ncbi:hypothetical protein [Streptomyces sp. NPDC050560]|uniref:hypothetical protein n=1 Tax=Streptomyces sp. NPDC050560 TaxID=3365630 RepID=UPI0037AB8CFD
MNDLPAGRPAPWPPRPAPQRPVPPPPPGPENAADGRDTDPGPPAPEGHAPDAPGRTGAHQDAPEEADERDGPDAAGPHPGPAGPEALGVPRSPTGNAEVDARLARLADTDLLATDGHLEVYEDVHRALRDTLTALDAPPGPRPPAPAPHDHTRS